MTSRIDEDVVRHVAHLARLDVSADEVARFARQLSSILNHFEQLGELDTTDEEPTAHALPVTNVFRDDTVRASWTPDRALHNAPETEGGFFRVPKVLDQQGS